MPFIYAILFLRGCRIWFSSKRQPLALIARNGQYSHTWGTSLLLSISFRHRDGPTSVPTNFLCVLFFVAPYKIVYRTHGRLHGYTIDMGMVRARMSNATADWYPYPECPRSTRKWGNAAGSSPRKCIYIYYIPEVEIRHIKAKINDKVQKKRMIGNCSIDVIVRTWMGWEFWF